jgi:DNA modification methylase
VAFAVALEYLDVDARLYLFGGSGNLSMYSGLFDAHLRQQVHIMVWVKESFVLRPNGYHSQFELVYFGWKGRGGDLVNWYGDRKMSDVWQVSRDSGLYRVHPTQKPVAVCSIPIRNSCEPGGLVYEPFGGSGSTLIAAHGLGRRARVLELDPHYVDVICRRFQEHTGEKPVLERTGEPVDFTEVM